MRKSTLALSVLVVLGVIWTGGAWYTGKVAESELQDQLDRLNQQARAYVALGYEVKIENAKLDRGIFSSENSYDVRVKSLKDNQTWVFPFAGKLYHGPLPLNRLSRFDFMPAMFSAEDGLVKNEMTESYFSAANTRDEPINAEITVSYDREMKGYVNIAAGNITLPDTENATDMQIHWSNARVTYQINRKADGKIDYHVDLFQLLKKGQNDILTEMEFKDMQGVSEFQQTAFKHIFTGQQKGTVGEFNYKLIRAKTPPATLQLKDWAFNNQVGLSDNFVDFNIGTNAQVTLNNRQLGNLSFDGTLSHLEADTVEDLIANGIESNSPLSENDRIALGKKLLKNAPHFTAKQLAITNEKGKVITQADIALSGEDIAQSLKKGKILVLFNQFMLRADMDKTALTQVLAAFDSSAKDKEQAVKEAEQVIAKWAKNLKSQHIIVDSDNNMKAELNIENGELKLNGEVIPEELIGMFIFSMNMDH